MELKTEFIQLCLSLVPSPPHTLDKLNEKGILVTDMDGKIIGYNRKFLEIWRIPKSLMDSEDPDQALPSSLNPLKGPDMFLKKDRELYVRQEAEDCKLIELKDGRRLRLCLQLQETEGNRVGRVWSFQDITVHRWDRRKAVENEIPCRTFNGGDESLLPKARGVLFPRLSQVSQPRIE